MEGKSTLDTAARIQQLVVVTRQLTVRYTVHHATSRRKSNSYEDLWALSRPTLAFVSVSQPRTCRCMSTRPGVYKYIPLPVSHAYRCAYIRFRYLISSLTACRHMQSHCYLTASLAYSNICRSCLVLNAISPALSQCNATWHMFLDDSRFVTCTSPKPARSGRRHVGASLHRAVRGA
jgi:hypothetical protein